MRTDSHGRKDSEWYFPAKEYTVNNGRKEGEQTATGRSDTGGIAGSEIRHRAVQAQTLRLHSSTAASRTAAAAQGIRILHRTVIVRPDYPGNPGAAGTGEMHLC